MPKVFLQGFPRGQRSRPHRAWGTRSSHIPGERSCSQTHLVRSRLWFAKVLWPAWCIRLETSATSYLLVWSYLISFNSIPSFDLQWPPFLVSPPSCSPSWTSEMSMVPEELRAEMAERLRWLRGLDCPSPCHGSASVSCRRSQDPESSPSAKPRKTREPESEENQRKREGNWNDMKMLKMCISKLTMTLCYIRYLTRVCWSHSWKKNTIEGQKKNAKQQDWNKGEVRQKWCLWLWSSWKVFPSSRFYVGVSQHEKTCHQMHCAKLRV